MCFGTRWQNLQFCLHMPTSQRRNMILKNWVCKSKLWNLSWRSLDWSWGSRSCLARFDTRKKGQFLCNLYCIILLGMPATVMHTQPQPWLQMSNDLWPMTNKLIKIIQYSVTSMHHLQIWPGHPLGHKGILLGELHLAAVCKWKLCPDCLATRLNILLGIWLCVLSCSGALYAFYDIYGYSMGSFISVGLKQVLLMSQPSDLVTLLNVWPRDSSVLVK